MSDLAKSMSDLPLKQQAIRAKCVHPTGTFVEFAQEAIEQSIPERFQQKATKYPEQVAVKTERRALTYHALNRAANRVAGTILTMQGTGPEPVALLFENGVEAIAAILGTLKAGKCYVPLDPSFPRGRIASILADSGTRLLVTNGRNFRFASELTSGRSSLLDIDTIDASASEEDPCLPLSPTDFACIIYTSGSTGQPKGVIQTHRGLLHWAMIHTNTLHITPSDRLTLLHSWSVASCMHHLFGALLNGASLFPFDPRLGGGERLASWLLQEQVTLYHSVPMVFRQMAAALLDEEEFPHLRSINLSGAPITRSDVELYKRHLPSGCILLHMIGTTETGWIRHYFVDKDTPMTGHVVPVGYPVPDMETLLLGEDGRDVGVDAVGEIAVRSRYLSPGYWRRPDLTQAAFRPDPAGGPERLYLTGDLGRRLPDGCLVHLGRKDFQVKIRGFRVEVAEVEGALLSLPSIKEAVVVAREDGPGEQRLVAYLVPTRRPAPTVSVLRRGLAATLPDYMIPSAFVVLDSLPLTPAGKVDRLGLPAPSRARPELDSPRVAPRTPVEATLCAIWGDVLGLDEVGIHDHFLELGGNSLLASQVVSRIIETLHLNLPLRALFEAPTVVGVAAAIAEALERRPDREERGRILEELEQLSEDEAKRLLTRGMPKDSEEFHG